MVLASENLDGGKPVAFVILREKLPPELLNELQVL
jgi:hypothetical protein